MNLFLPYGADAIKNTSALDDKRLIKQIVECKTLLNIYNRKQAGEKRIGYVNHPVYVYHEQNDFMWYIAYYGLIACNEYQFRFDKIHTDHEWFRQMLNQLIDFNTKEELQNILDTYIPYYAAGAKNTPSCIRTTENVEQLFQNKLKEKWNYDISVGRQPKWTNSQSPDFFKGDK